jgi:hypothetical protein
MVVKIEQATKLVFLCQQLPKWCHHQINNFLRWFLALYLHQPLSLRAGSCSSSYFTTPPTPSTSTFRAHTSIQQACCPLHPIAYARTTFDKTSLNSKRLLCICCNVLLLLFISRSSRSPNFASRNNKSISFP